MKRNILAAAAALLFCLALSSCNKTKSCAAYSQADQVEQNCETNS